MFRLTRKGIEELTQITNLIKKVESLLHYLLKKIANFLWLVGGVLLVLFSCEKDPQNRGVALSESSDNQTKSYDLAPQIYTQVVDLASFINKPNRLVLGAFSRPVFGVVSASYAAAFQDDKIPVDFGNDPILKEVLVVFDAAYEKHKEGENAYKIKDFYGDAQQAKPLSLGVYSLDANFSASNKETIKPVALLGKNTVMPFLQEVKKESNPSQETLSIALDKAFFDDEFFKPLTQKSAKLEELIKGKFSGIYIKPESKESFSFSVVPSEIYLLFKYSVLENQRPVEKSWKLPLSSLKDKSFSLYDFKDESYKEVDPSKPSESLYLQSFRRSYLKLQLTAEELQTLKKDIASKRGVLMRANLHLYPDFSLISKEQASKYIMGFVEEVENQGKTDFQNRSLGNYNEDKKCYVLDVTSYMSSLLKDKGVAFKPLVLQSSIFADKTPNSANTDPSQLILFGEDSKDKKPTINLICTFE